MAGFTRKNVNSVPTRNTAPGGLLGLDETGSLVLVPFSQEGNSTGINWRGNYVSTTLYAARDAVSFNGSSWIARQNNTSHQPSAASAYWDLLAEKGDDATGGSYDDSAVRGLITQNTASIQALQSSTQSAIANLSTRIGGAESSLSALASAFAQQNQQITGLGTRVAVLESLGSSGGTGTGTPGPAGMVWRGAYAANVAYAARDGVFHNGSSYIALQASTGQAPTNPLYWSIVAQRGSDGTGTAGPVGMNWRGTYGSTVSYAVRDVVSYGGSSWICIQDGTGQAPSASSTYWNLLAQRGDDGQGGGSGGGGMSAVYHDSSLDGSGTADAPLAVVRPVPSGAEGQVVGYGAGGALTPLSFPKNNYSATTGPTSGNNSGAGYQVGSRWINTSTNQKWTLTAINGTLATWTPDVSSSSGGPAYDDTEVRGLIAGNTAATNALSGRVGATEAAIGALGTTTGQHTTQIGGLTTRVTALEQGGGSGGGGLTSVAHDNSLTGAGTTGSPLGVARPVPSGAEGQVVGYGAGGALTPLPFAKNNYAATSAPTTGDNAGAGYSVGSRWINTATGDKWTLTAINGTIATWRPDLAVASGGGSSDLSLSNLPSGTFTTPFRAPATMTASGQGYPISLGFGISYDVRDFGAVMSTHTEAEAAQAVMQANLVALQAAIDKASELGFTVFVPSGKLYIWGTAYLKVGVSIRGESKFTSRIVQRLLPTSLAENWVPTLAAPAVTGSNQGGNGYNFISDLGVDCGWNMRDFIGATGATNANWMYDPARMVGHAIVFSTSSNGPQTSTVRPAASGTDPHCRVQNVYIANAPGAGVYMSGRGENFIIGLETSRCATNSIYDNAADCWILNSTGYMCGDSGVEIAGGGGNLRLVGTKMWFTGMSKRVEVVGAGYYSSSSGTKNIIGAAVTGQDNWGACFDFNHDGAVQIDGQADEAGGGRVEEAGTGGFDGTRTLPRCFIRLRTARRSEMRVTISGGDRNGVANRPFLVDFQDGGVTANNNAGIRHNIIHLSGSLAGVNMTTGTDPERQKNGVVCTSGYVTAGRFNEVFFGRRQLHGFMTVANLNNAAHPVNDPLYGPSRVTMDTGMPAYRRSYDGWYIPTIVRYVTQAQYDALSTTEQNDPVYIFQIIAAA